MTRSRASLAVKKALHGVFLASLGLASTSIYAGNRLFTFDDDSTAELTIFTNTTDPVRAEGGQSGGYLAITDAINDKFGVVIFPDIDDGKPVAAFTLEADVRIGNPTGNDGRPADGLSVSYVRADDPIVVNGLDNAANSGYDIRGDFSVGGAPEMGSRSGVVVSFDTWAGNIYRDGSADVEGVMVQVDGKVVKTYALPTRNGALTDTTSLETGPWDSANTGLVDGLGWAKLKVDLGEDGKLTVQYKGATILDKFQTAFYPSAGRIVFAGRTGGANANQHVDNVSLVTVPAAKLTEGLLIDNAFAYRAVFSDNLAIGSILDPATVTVDFDGVRATPTSFEKIGNDTFFYFDIPKTTPLASGSSHTAVINAKDTNGSTVGAARTATVPNYALIPAALASGIDAGTAERGFKARVQWVNGLQRAIGNGDANRTFEAERQINEAFLDTDGNPVVNEAILDGIDADGYLLVDGVINFDQGAAKQGNFGGETTFPGITGNTDPNNFSYEFSAYVLLEPGTYRFGVNSDDGFKHSVGRGLSDLNGVKLGEFDGGRGASDSIYDVVVTQTGLYPMRWLYWEGGGGANIEIFTITPDGVKHLLNDDTDEASVKVYRSGLAKSHIRQLSPIPGQMGGAAAESPIVIQVVDGAAPAGPVTVKVDGITTSASVVKDGAVSTLRIDYASGQNPGQHHVDVAFDDVSFGYNYNVAFLPKARAEGNFAIEAEDFDNNGAAVSADVNVMPYYGNSAAGQDSVLNVDFFDNDGNDSDKYRTENGNVQKVNITEQGVNNNQNQANRGSWDMTTNWRIGWIGGDNWYQYHRVVPAGDYTVVAALSFDGLDAGQLSGRLAIVDGDNCPSQPLGSFSTTGSGGWGQNNLVTLVDTIGNPVVYHSDGTEKTFRYSANSGDFDYFAFVPVVGVNIASAPAGAVAATGALNFTFVGAVDTASIALKVDGTAVSATVAATANGATVAGTRSTAWGSALSAHTYELSYKDAAGTSYTKTGSFKVLDGAFVIEAEDYNFGRGKTRDILSVMPYYGDGLAGLCEAAVQGTDINNPDGNDSSDYGRNEVFADGKPSNVNINRNIDGARGEDNDVNRGAWDVTANYKIGWTGGGDWHNYTRTIPAGNYEVWAALSLDGDGDHDLRASLQRVTSDASLPDQSVEQLGTFDGKGTRAYGGWGANRLVQLKTDDGQPSVVGVSGGAVTLRATIDSGDFDYFKLVPTGLAVRPKITSMVQNVDGTITITWIGGGTLNAAPSLDGPWQPIAGATSPFTFAPTAAQLFGRIVK